MVLLVLAAAAAARLVLLGWFSLIERLRMPAVERGRDHNWDLIISWQLYIPGNSLLGWLDEAAVSRHLGVVRLHLVLNLPVLDEQGVVLRLQKIFLFLLSVQLE